MHHDQFLDRVRELTGVATAVDAEPIARAVLETLGERVSKSQADDLAAQLPAELKPHLYTYMGHIGGEKRGVRTFSVREFFNKVGARSGCRHGEAKRRTEAVAAVLAEAISPGEIDDMLRELPDEFGILFGRQEREART
jgi:uncharacterized protein (DUF2267 family)